MRVLQINVNCKKSSTGKIVYDLFTNLKADGYEAAVCYGRGDKINEDGIYKFGFDWETYIHAGLARITGLNGYYSCFSTRRLIRFIENYKPDVIHLHELHAYYVNIKPLINYIKAKKIKTVWTFHCEYMYTGKCGHAYDCERWKVDCGNCPAVKDYPKSLMIDRTGKMLLEKKKLLSDWDFTIVTPSKWLAERVRMSFLHDKRIEVIHNGIDTKNVFHRRSETEIEATRKKYGLENKTVALFVAPDINNEIKGASYIFEISKYPENKDLFFVIVGSDKTQKTADNVLVVERITDQNELARLYSAANITLLASKRETFSLVTAESLCCGTPVVGFKAGAPETIALEKYSEFVEYGDLNMLACAARKWIDRNLNPLEISAAATERYSADKMVREYEKLFSN